MHRSMDVGQSNKWLNLSIDLLYVGSAMVHSFELLGHQNLFNTFGHSRQILTSKWYCSCDAGWWLFKHWIPVIHRIWIEVNSVEYSIQVSTSSDLWHVNKMRFSIDKYKWINLNFWWGKIQLPHGRQSIARCAHSLKSSKKYSNLIRKSSRFTHRLVFASEYSYRAHFLKHPICQKSEQRNASNKVK